MTRTRERTVATTWGKTRIEALSDGVFAIAITLLVLDIRIPDLERPVSNADAWHAIRAVGPTLASFLITFVLSGSYWFMHHATFHSIRSVTRPIAMLNLPFLMFVSLLPFSTSLLGKLGLVHPVALAVYFSNQLALALSLNLLWLIARRHGLIEEPLPDPTMRFVIGAQPIGCLAAMAAIAVNPMASYWVYLFVAIAARRIARRRFKPLRADAPAPL